MRTVLGTDVYSVYIEGNQDYGKNYSDGTVFFNGDTIYSYGYHFPMAHRMHDGSYIVNGDTYSNTTSKHQSNLRTALQQNKTTIIPFSALQSAGINFKKVEVIDQEDEKNWTEKRKRYNYNTGEYETVEVNIHLMGSSLFKYNKHGKDIYYLSGLDETGKNPHSSFFLVELDGQANTVEGAYDMLKPDEVIMAEDIGKTVLRQGEWFFVPVTDKDRIKYLNKTAKENVEKNELLKNRDKDREYRHKVTNYLEVNGSVYAKGTCRHTDGEHKMLKLNGWHKVFENVQVQSFTSIGRID